MFNSSMPKTLRGDWIWRRSLFDKRSVFLFARKEFTLDHGGLQGDLWVSANTSYNLFVNDRHLGFGPPPGTDETCYAVQYDITYYLETGINVIALVVHHRRETDSSRPSRAPGLWCQIEADGKPIVWTDASWRLVDGAYCLEPREAIGVSGGVLGERVKISHYPRGWTLAGYDDSSWGEADCLSSVQNGERKLMISPVPMSLSGEIETGNRVAGRSDAPCLVNYVSFNDIFQGAPGSYAATTMIHSGEKRKARVVLNFGDEVALFLNDQPVLPKTGIKSQNGLRRYHKRCQEVSFPLEGDRLMSVYDLELEEGWNRFMIIQNLNEIGVGVFLVFPDLVEGDVSFFCEESTESLAGWKTHGPLKLPFTMISAPLDFNRKKTCLFHPMTENVNDLSVFLENCVFEEDPSGGEKETLTSGDYRVYDFTQEQFGFPSLFIQGNNGDVIDILYGEELKGGIPAPNNSKSRRGDTLVLREGENLWTKFEPCKTRYLMVLAREAAEGVVVDKVAMSEFLREYENETYFQCSESEFNQIWDVGRETLKRSAIYEFSDFSSPSRRQRLNDAMIQSLAMSFTYGDFTLTEKALREFAGEQYENGFIPSEVPARTQGFDMDVSLLWPVWLNYHLSLSGHKDFRDEMLPCLDNFLRCLEGLAKMGNGLLCDLSKTHQLGLFIDYDSDIDDRGACCALNALYCRSLLSSASVYQHAGLEERSAACRNAASKVAKMIREQTWDAEKGLFSDCNFKGRKSSRHSFETNIFALYSGVAPRESFESIFNHFFIDEPPFRCPDTPDSSLYFNFFILETLCAYGLSDWAMKYIKHVWGKMIGRGLKTWEPVPDSKDHGGQLFGSCFGGGTSPNVFLVRELAGLRPVDLDFSTIYFNPALGSAEWVKTSMHSPLGRINLEWSLNSRGELEVKVEANYPLDIIPVLPESITEKTTFHFGSKIAVLEPE